MPRSFLTDGMWDKLVPLLPPEKGETGRPYNAHRPWLEAILWKHRTGAPWRDLPEEFGSWKSLYSRFKRWSKVGLWQAALEVLRQDADTERPPGTMPPWSRSRVWSSGSGFDQPVLILPFPFDPIHPR